MITITDCVAIVLSISFLARGNSRGFIRSLLNPFSIIVTTILSILYYKITKDMIISLMIGLFGPLLLNIILNFSLKSWAMATDSDFKPGFLSRLAGAILTLAWGWVFIIFTLIFLTLLPPWGDGLNALHHDILRSITYNSIVKPAEDIFFEPLKPTSAQSTTIAANNDAGSLINDPRFQEIMKDPTIQKEIDARDFTRLMSNPKIMALTQQIMSDPATLKKVMTLYSNQINQPASKNQ